MRKREKITAERDGQQRKFYLATWQQMPADKYGWKIVKTAPPKVVKEAIEKAGGDA